MEKPSKIMRRSIHISLKNYHYLVTTPALLALPFSLSVLLSSSSSSSSSTLLPWIYHRLRTLFDAAGFPPSSQFFNILTLKLSQTISSSIFTLPFTLTFLLVAKASTIQALKQQHKQTSSSSILSLFSPLLLTYICNSFLVVAANSTVFSLSFFAFNILQGSGSSSHPNCILFLSAAAAVVYSIVLANALMICNLALVLSAMERSGGYLAILKACVLIRGRTSTALSLALPLNLAMAGIEALFQYRILRDHHHFGDNKSMASMVLEGMLISYLYSIAVVVDTVVSCMFYKSCKTQVSWIPQEDSYSYQIVIPEEYTEDYKSLKNHQEF